MNYKITAKVPCTPNWVVCTNGKLGGNILSYVESEDAYYIQYGADAVPKKLGSEPVVLTGTISGTGGSVTIPSGLTYVCAGITSTSGCTAYKDYPTSGGKQWTVSTNWSYDSNTGKVSFGIGLGASQYLGANPKLNFMIMYIPV